MKAEKEESLPLEIGHILFIDIVAYSKLLMNEQHELVEELNRIVSESPQFRRAENDDDFIRLPTGDGMALVFRDSPETPARCALEIGKALQSVPHLRVRMGIHSGPVHPMSDLNQRPNIAGAGINVARRVMDYGDAGHILVSQRVADDLAQYREWSAHLHPLGECEAKHGVPLAISNLYTSEVGNPETPQRFSVAKNSSKTRLVTALVLAAVALIGGIWFFVQRSERPDSGNGLQSSTGKTLAVLPFENLSDDKQNSYFTDGMQDEIVTHLSKIADLRVISRTSVMQYKGGAPRNLCEIARTLGVAHVLEGSVQRAENHVRVNAQLIDAQTDAHLWAETYDRDLADVFAIQSEIAKAIAEQLQATLSPREKAAIAQRPTADIGAYDFYTHAVAIFDAVPFGGAQMENVLQAIDLLQAAIRRDPNFVAAYCKMANAHDFLYLSGLDHTPERRAAAEAAVESALRLQPDSGIAHLARARHLYSILEYDRARREIEVVRQTLPNDPQLFEVLAYIDRREGRWSDYARNMERALELDPRNAAKLQQLSSSYRVLRQYAREAAALDRVIALNPADINSKIQRAFVEANWRADLRPLHALINGIIAQNPTAASKLVPMRIYLAVCERDLPAAREALVALGDATFGLNAVQFTRSFGEGLLARMNNDPAAATTAFTIAKTLQEEVVRKQPDYGPALAVLGLIEAGLGEKENALREGRRAIELLPVAKDALNGPSMLETFATICAWTGERDLAIENLRAVVQMPGSLSYGLLKLSPFWDPLRGDPEFEKIVESLAPKGTSP